MHLDSPRFAPWPISGRSSTNSVNILPQRATSTTCASSCARPQRPSRRTSKNLRFLMTANRGYVLYDEIDALVLEGYGGGADLNTILSELTKNEIEILEEARAGFPMFPRRRTSSPALAPRLSFAPRPRSASSTTTPPPPLPKFIPKSVSISPCSLPRSRTP